MPHQSDAWYRIVCRPLLQVRCKKRHDHLLLVMVCDFQLLNLHPLRAQIGAKNQLNCHHQRLQAPVLCRRFTAYEDSSAKIWSSDLGPLRRIVQVCLSKSPTFQNPSGESLFYDRSYLLRASYLRSAWELHLGSQSPLWRKYFRAPTRTSKPYLHGRILSLCKRGWSYHSVYCMKIGGYRKCLLSQSATSQKFVLASKTLKSLVQLTV